MRIAARAKAFTLIELLVVIGIIGLLATLGMGALRGFSATNVIAAGNRQLLDDIAMARNTAQSRRTTVYMVFVPALTNVPAMMLKNPDEKKQFTNRLSGQFSSYNFLTLRSLGDQPGQKNPRYLSEWKHLPEGVFLNLEKFTPMTQKDWIDAAGRTSTTNLPLPRISVPFPTAKSEEIELPVLAFSYRGELLGPNPDKPRQRDEIISLTRGSVIYPKDDKGRPTQEAPEVIETPRGNSTNNPYIRIDWITGRARVEDPKT